MLASELITKIRRQLVETVGSFWSDAELLDLLNDAELNFNNEVRLLQGKYITSMIQGQQDYPLPSNWLSEAAIFVNNPSSTGVPQGRDAWQRLRTTSLEKEAQENANFLSVDPNSFDFPLSGWIWNHTLFLDPTPDKNYPSSLVMFYYSKPIPLTSVSQDMHMDDSFKDALMAYALWKAWLKEKEKALADEAHLEYLKGVRDGRRWVKKQSVDLRNRLDIDSPLPFSPSGGFSKGFNPFI